MRKINKHFWHLVSSTGKRRKTDNNKKKKEAEKRTDEKEATKLYQGNFKNNMWFQNDIIQMTSKKKNILGGSVMSTHAHIHTHTHTHAHATHWQDRQVPRSQALRQTSSWKHIQKRSLHEPFSFPLYLSLSTAVPLSIPLPSLCNASGLQEF